MHHPATPLAHTRQGSLLGLTDDNTHCYRGIPFATPPVGALRWRSPQPVTPWEGVRDAQTFSPASWQNIDYCREFGGGDPGRFSEDCLYLNVWTPAERTHPLPVMVWLAVGLRLGRAVCLL